MQQLTKLCNFIKESGECCHGQRLNSLYWWLFTVQVRFDMFTVNKMLSPFMNFVSMMKVNQCVLKTTQRWQMRRTWRPGCITVVNIQSLHIARPEFIFCWRKFSNRLSPETPIFSSPFLSFDLTPDNLVHLSRGKMQTHHWLMVQTRQMVRQPIMIRGKGCGRRVFTGFAKLFLENHSRLPLPQTLQ